MFNEYFGDLVTSLKSCCLEISNDCVSKKLISVSTHNNTLYGSGTLTEKTTKLLDGIRSSLTHQRECFHKFLAILKDQLIFEELIGRMETSLKETKERKVIRTAECTSDNFLEHFTKETSPEAAQAPTEVDIVRVRKTVIKSYLKQISGVVRGRVVTIASDSCTNELISSNIYKQIVHQ